MQPISDQSLPVAKRRQGWGRNEDVIDIPNGPVGEPAEPPVHKSLKDSRGCFQTKGHSLELISDPPAQKSGQVPVHCWHADAEKRVLQIETREPGGALDPISNVLKSRQRPVKRLSDSVGRGTVDAYPDPSVLLGHKDEVIEERRYRDWFDDAK
jgi:hypothetical protein